ncbi:unnamed protein product [Mytilus coruscus]|uniref:Integrase zinc-binding domain-containing protein n=1 Tax=Mytilus coruscus TaxID=42192 RepID=A0A6J8EBE6_MYTCO|nr:unnamed protein product [Mytilus coruscus]
MTAERETVLSLGHDIPLAGHLGNKKTKVRIMQHFFWPGIFNDIAEYCRSCPDCQIGTSIPLKDQEAGTPQTWDEYIPYLLFAYREVPNESTGFSPFELLYGRHIRGPLLVFEAEWEEPSTCQHSVLSYLLVTREKMRTMAEYATENEKKAKQGQKLYFDRKARDRKLEVGQKVLILLPTHTLKLLTSWKGPFVVTDPVSPVYYKAMVKGKEKVFPVNVLKLWHERVDNDKDNSVPMDIVPCLNVISGLSTDDGTDDSEMTTAITPVLKRKESADDVKISPELTDEEIQQLKKLLSEYEDIFSDVPKVPLDKDSRQKSAFMTPFGYYQFTVTPFGMIIMKNSGATFIRMKDKVLVGYKEFIDNIGIFSDTW